MSKDSLPIFPRKLTENEIRALSPSVLSFIGDGVQTLYARTKLADVISSRTGPLHRLVAAEVNATRQAAAAKSIMDALSESETQIFKRCRNTKTATVAKHASVVDYKVASGFEGLLGYLYLIGNHERLAEILELSYPERSEEKERTTVSEV